MSVGRAWGYFTSTTVAIVVRWWESRAHEIVIIFYCRRTHMQQKLDCKTIARKSKLKEVLQIGGTPVAMAQWMHLTRNTYNNCRLKKMDTDRSVQSTNGEWMHTNCLNKVKTKGRLIAVRNVSRKIDLVLRNAWWKNVLSHALSSICECRGEPNLEPETTVMVRSRK